MPAWFVRIHPTRQCPDKLSRAVQRIREGGKAAPETVPEPAAAPVERVAVAEEEMGMLAMLTRHREAEATLHKKYMLAVDAGNETRADFLRREWTAMAEKVRQLEKIAPTVLEEAGIYVKRAEVQRELEPLHRAILKSFKQAFRMCRPKLKAAETPEEWNRLTDDIVDEAAAMLASSNFSEPLELEAA
jgi:hypothetical protein